MQSKRNTVVLLRWVLIIAFSYLIILDSATNAQPWLVVLIAVVLASNLVVARMPDRWTQTQLFDLFIVLFDAAWVTLGLVFAPHVSSDLFLLYFLVIFVAAMGESLTTIVGSAALVSMVYGYTLSFQSGADFRLTTAGLLRVPFLFVVALFYGYFVTEIRGRRTEAAEARLREQAKTELLSAVSHDLRGPLGNAENLLALLVDAHGQGSVPDLSLLLRAQVNVRRVTTLVTNLLEAACIEAGHVNFQWAPLQLNDVVDDTLNLEAGAALLKGVALTKDLEAQMPVLTSDLVQMGRILVNLVNNAIKYTAAGGRVVVRTRFSADQVTMGVADTGPGMSAEQCAAVFAPYERVHLGGYTEGKGLGLYIVKRLTEAMGGTVAVRSTPGVGTTFEIVLPRAARDSGASRFGRRDERGPAKRLGAEAVTHAA